jgi:hypothetical protein
METPDPCSCMSLANPVRDWAACKSDSAAELPVDVVQEPRRATWAAFGVVQMALEWLGAEQPSGCDTRRRC